MQITPAVEHRLAVQVVAGTNYKLLLDVANSANKMEHIEATVYGAGLPNSGSHAIILAAQLT